MVSPFVRERDRVRVDVLASSVFPLTLILSPPKKKGERRQGLITQIRSCTREVGAAINRAE